MNSRLPVIPSLPRPEGKRLSPRRSNVKTNRVRGAGGRPFKDGLAGLRNLTHIGQQSPRHLTKLPVQHSRKKQKEFTLKIQHHARRIPMAHAVAELAKVIFRAKCIELDLACTISREHRFVEVILNNCNANVLSFKGCNLGSLSIGTLARVLASSIEHFTEFTELDLSANPIGDQV